ncbi:MAG: class I SAM-dependent methyltransferase [Akkermansiaceae bacterium]|nr:class I SAM-dependent methyltransferase [Akkermansiaceae bacterium]
MSTPNESPTHFDEDRAASYDERFNRISAVMEALHLLTKLWFTGLPKEARVLCVGAGTGAELFPLAEAFPGWTFTLVDPAGPMLAQCRRKAEAAGIADRCIFHEGYLDSLPATAPFDAATSILVSHFVLEREKRIAFFREISGRLKPGAPLVSADLCSDMDSPEFATLISAWINMLKFSGQEDKTVDSFVEALRGGVDVVPPQELTSLIRSGGFAESTLFYQSLLIHGFISKRG